MDGIFIRKSTFLIRQQIYMESSVVLSIMWIAKCEAEAESIYYSAYVIISSGDFCGYSHYTSLTRVSLWHHSHHSTIQGVGKREYSGKEQIPGSSLAWMVSFKLMHCSLLTPGHGRLLCRHWHCVLHALYSWRNQFQAKAQWKCSGLLQIPHPNQASKAEPVWIQKDFSDSDPEVWHSGPLQ